MFYRLILLICLVFNTAFVYAEDGPAYETIVVAGHPDYPPIMWKKENRVLGVASRVVEEFFKEFDVKLDRSYLGPWKRVQGLAKHGHIDVIASCYMNDERLSYLEFSQPILKDETVIFVRNGEAFEYNSWEDLIGKKGVTLFGDSYGEKFDKFCEEKLRVKKVYGLEEALDSLLNRQVDYLFFGYYPTIVMAKLLGKDAEIEKLSKPLVEEDMYIAFSKQSNFKKFIPQLNIAIKNYKRNGLIDKWTEEYLLLHTKDKEN